MFKNQQDLKKQQKQNMGQQNKHQNMANKKVNHILQKCFTQNEHFQEWAKQEKWATFHHSHYDWWAFPINQRSSYGDQYKIMPVEIQIMKKDQKFLSTLKKNAQLVCLSWGYLLKEGQQIVKQNRQQYQKWQNWPIRLYKMSKSLQIFQCQQQFANAVKYGNMLIGRGMPMQYGKRNIKRYFQDCSLKLKTEKEQK